MGDVEVIQGDCLAVMGGMAAGSVDHVITDPPFGEITHKGARTLAVGADNGRLVTFDAMTPESFLEFSGECVRVASRWVVMFCEWQFAALLEPAGLPLVRLGVWVKPNSAPQLTGDRPATGWEAVAILHRPGKKRWNAGGKRAVWTCNRVDAKHHPTEKPLKIVSEILRDFTDRDELILDPCAGSGTTGVACLKTGRRVILIEKNPKYVDVIHRRLAAASTPLFDLIPAGGPTP